MSRRPPGPDVAPPVQKVRLRYAKRGRLRFSSHRDFQRMLERALRRMEAPMAYSGGFNPHPRISFAGAAPTGMASEAEFFELGLCERVDPQQLAQQLSDSLPPGLDILQAVEASGGSLADQLTGSIWQLELPGVSVTELNAAIAAFTELKEYVVTRVTKKGDRKIDVVAAVVRLSARSSDEQNTQFGASVPQLLPGCAILDLVVRHTTPVVRPDDILTALRETADLTPESPPRVTRLAQGLLDAQTATVADPLAE